MKKHFANFFTLLNLFFGCLALLYLFDVDYYYSEELSSYTWVIIPEKMYLTSFFILLAAIADFLDGFVARFLNIQSDMGKQLDSLSDLVSFGLVPGCIIFKFLNTSLSNLIIKEPYSWGTKIMSLFSNQENSNFAPLIFLIPAFLIPLTAAYRLARFNVSSSNSYNFAGLPTPFVGLFIAIFPILFWHPNYLWVFKILNDSALFWYLIIAVLSYLMISKQPMLSLKYFKNDRLKIMGWLVIVVCGFILLILFKWLGLLFGFILYLLVSLIYAQINNKKAHLVSISNNPTDKK